MKENFDVTGSAYLNIQPIKQLSIRAVFAGGMGMSSNRIERETYRYYEAKEYLKVEYNDEDELIQSFILSISGNPLIAEVLAVNLLCGLTASSSGGLGATLEALGPTFLQQGIAQGISPGVLHRVASIASGGLDSLPHNGATVTTLSLCRISHREGYLDMFMCSVVIPIGAAILCVILGMLGLNF